MQKFGAAAKWQIFENSKLSGFVLSSLAIQFIDLILSMIGFFRFFNLCMNDFLSFFFWGGGGGSRAHRPRLH